MYWSPLLIVGVMWPVPSGSYCRDSPAKMDYNLGFWAKVNPFSPELFFQGFITAPGSETKTETNCFYMSSFSGIWTLPLFLAGKRNLFIWIMSGVLSWPSSIMYTITQFNRCLIACKYDDKYQRKPIYYEQPFSIHYSILLDKFKLFSKENLNSVEDLIFY